MFINLTQAAKSHFISLIDAQSKDMKVNKLNLRIEAIRAGTHQATLELSYCTSGDQESSDIPINYGEFILYVDNNSKAALTNAIIDYKQDKEGSLVGKLHIKAPFLKGDDFESDKQSLGTQDTGELDLFAKIKDFINKEISPLLARHNGLIKLQTINNLEVGVEVVLQFDGGCKGCSMVDFTLKQSIEKSLRNKFSEIVLITDATDHAAGKNPFCK